MEQYQIEVELLSETIFGSGESISNFIDIEILKDEYGIPYMKGKTFKGKLRKEIEGVALILENINGKSYKDEVDSLLGKEGSYKWDRSNILDTLKFSNCHISNKIRAIICKEIEDSNITKEEVLGALTEIRSFTSIDSDGIAKDGSLRQARVVKKDMTYYVDVNVGRSLSCLEKGLLAAGVSALRNIGSMESRGKGKVRCKLLKDGIDVTMEYIDKLEKEVH